MNKNIIIFDSNTFPLNFLKEIRKKFTKFNFIIIKNNDVKKLDKEIPKAQVLINCPRKYFTEKLFTKFDKMEWVHTSAAGVDEYMIPSFVQSDIKFTNGKILQGPEVADHALGLILALTRNLKFDIKSINFAKNKRPLELLKKKALVVGSGGIGTCILDRLKGFGVISDVISEELPPMTSNINNFYEIDAINKICRNYDIIVSAAPLTKKTNKIFSKIFFSKMKKNSIFINVSRGALVDTNVLSNKKMIEKFWGIGLDVVNPEPLSKNHFLKKQDNVIITNHTAGLSDHNRARAYELIVKNLKRFYNQEILFNEVNKTEGY
jgi:phosphoglycerate dehydrogenase-like enzyme